MRLEVGSMFAERYRVERCIATGAMGAVYEVTHLETERRRALKVMRPEIVRREDLRQRFREEAKVAARIDSEFIVDVYDAGVDAATGVPFLVMELLAGESLGARIERGPIPYDEALRYLRQAAAALDKSHQARIVHRDLKPENLFLVERADGSRQIKVLDFGIAKLIEGSQADAATRNLGTPLYMAPEQFKGGQPIAPQTDVYALAMVVFAMLVGSPYWLDEARGQGSVVGFMAAAIVGPTEPPVPRARRRGVELPAAFDAWFLRAAAPEASQRFAGAGEAVDALARALDVAPPTPSTRLLPTSPVTPSTTVTTAPPPAAPITVAGAPPAAAPAATLVSAQGAHRPRAPLYAAIALLSTALLATGIWLVTRDGKRRKHRDVETTAVEPEKTTTPSAAPTSAPSESGTAEETDAETDPKDRRPRRDRRLPRRRLR
jgi:eukaryotic-like serine/threonine-protein kinase